MKHVATGDRNAYDRCIFHVVDHRGRALLILGLGVYPNVGVIDAYATLRIGDTLHAVRASDALPDDRMGTEVGPLRIHVERPLRDFLLTCAADPDDPDGLSYEIAWSAEFPALWEPHHLQRRGGRLTLEGRRFVQAGRCEGWIRIGGEEIRLSADEWTGTRDRSWGVRPIPGEDGGRFTDPADGFHWIWAPARFEDRFVMVVIQEDADGYRTLNDATLVRNGRRDLQLGWPQAEITYRSGTRHPRHVVIQLTDPIGRKPMELGLEVLTSSPLAVGAGYPPADDWQHGTWRGLGWTDRRRYDLSDPSAHPLAAYGVTDHAARFTLDGQVGHGIFEHGSFGRHDPSGFTGFGSVAP
ncbi:hypothetical protein ACFOZ0_00550 [Streptomyces yaanensis]|uniref:Uncharacterized protein n=1 Tax=Streptomyces yaanensis TaxID=1142239 RepID=A0ABV7S7S8_9ACTN|nr:hypothetical protein [Streptomyces sp. CGMCC 4.7035]WNC03194.1 hypothetical protein Q2K21_22510 [Streptomyces sp. CGMCC 4.7035]